MPKRKKMTGELMALEPSNQVTLMPPTSGVIGRFLDDTHNMFKARAMRMKGLFNRINESGDRTEGLLRMAAETMEAAEAKLEQDLFSEGLLPDADEEYHENGDD